MSIKTVLTENRLAPPYSSLLSLREDAINALKGAILQSVGYVT